MTLGKPSGPPSPHGPVSVTTKGNSQNNTSSLHFKQFKGCVQNAYMHNFLACLSFCFLWLGSFIHCTLIYQLSYLFQSLVDFLIGGVH